ncbi:MAG TPA: SRPBCC family protein [Solirubrobacteraceae bacterium]|nr:SRPBCC family protein [Solirubrobacteraceae bacterium]
MSDRSTNHATFVIERTYDAAPARVWRAWSEPEQKLRWFGPRDLEKPDHELDFRVGGHERIAVRTPDGALYTFLSRYHDIIENERFVHTYEMYRNEARISVSVATIELESAGAGTKLTITEQGVFLDALDTPEAREHGTRELLETLAEALV